MKSAFPALLIPLTATAVLGRAVISLVGGEIRPDRAWIWPAYFGLLGLGWLAFAVVTIKHRAKR